MIKATVVFTSYHYDRDEGTAHAFVQTSKGIEVHQFEFKYSIFDFPDDDKDIKNITDILQKMYGDNIEITFAKKDFYHDVDYRHYDD